MNYSASLPIDLKTAFTSAENIAKSKSPKAKFILDLITPKKDRGYLNLCYAYLRWVDDYVDNPKIDNTNKLEFISRQKTLCEKFKYRILDDRLSYEECFLFYFVCYTVDNNKLFLHTALSEMLDSIAMDAKRLAANGIYTSKEMQVYIDKNTKAFFTLITSFVEPNNSLVSSNIFVGKFTTKLFMLRDFMEDVKRGYVNISKEDLKSYRIDISNLRDSEALKKWTEEEFQSLIKLLYEESLVIKTFSLKLKVFNYYSQIYYLPKICRIAANGFDIIKTRNRHNLITEIRTYLFSVKLAVKVFIIEFT